MVLTVRQGSKPNNYPLWRERLVSAEGDSPSESISNFPSLSQPLSCDVAIIGGGFSGLWSAFHLNLQQPSLDIAVFEDHEIGFGASGRNGGWVSSDYPTDVETLKKRYPYGEIDRFFDLMRSSIDEIGEFADSYSKGSNFTKSGSLIFALNQAQLSRLTSQVRDRKRLLAKQEASEMLAVDGIQGALFEPDCATVSPYQLLHDLARYLRSRGVQIFERSRAEASGQLRVNGISVTAMRTIWATEAFKEPSRQQIPLYSLMVATAPLVSEKRKELSPIQGLAFAQASHNVNYAQFTGDGRIALGGRGARYPFGSKLSSKNELDERVHRRIASLIGEWFPQLGNPEEIEITHRWGGPIAVRWNWESYVHFDDSTGIGSLGGYVGDGLTMSYLSAKVLADLVLGGSSYKGLPIVNNRAPQWPIEPLRYLGANAFISLINFADVEERWSGRESVIYKVISKVIGK